jgi:hypothetical protein
MTRRGWLSFPKTSRKAKGRQPMSDYLDARRYQAMKTDQSNGRGWDLRPDLSVEPRVPGSVKVIMGIIVLAGVLAVVAPSIARMVMA